MRAQGLVMVLAVACLGFSACMTADLRSDTLEKMGAQPPADREAQGKALLNALAERHGVTAWKQHETVEVVFRDIWDSALASVMGLVPWNAEDQIQMRFQTGTFNIRAEFVDGPRRGEVMGVQSWKTYGRANAQEEIAFGEVDHAGFMLPALSYLMELPLRLTQAEVVAYEGERTLEGRRYDVVLATWQSMEPSDGVDQYLLWIDKETGLLGLVDYTVREQGSFFSARTYYKDMRAVDGVTMAHTMTIVAVGDGPDDGYLHEVKVDSVRFDAFPISQLYPDGSLEFIGDAKASR